jgi:hypothetical protein
MDASSADGAPNPLAEESRVIQHVRAPVVTMGEDELSRTRRRR